MRKMSDKDVEVLDLLAQWASSGPSRADKGSKRSFSVTVEPLRSDDLGQVCLKLRCDETLKGKCGLAVDNRTASATDTSLSQLQPRVRLW